MPANLLFAAAGCTGIACGVALGLSTPTTMKPMRPSELPNSAAAISRSASYPGYASVPEDATTGFAHVNAAHYRDYAVDTSGPSVYPDGIEPVAAIPNRRTEPEWREAPVSAPAPGSAAASIADLQDLNARWPSAAPRAASANAPATPLETEAPLPQGSSTVAAAD